MHIEKLTKLLSITEEKDIEVLNIIVEIVTNQILTYVSDEVLHPKLEWILLEMCVRRFRDVSVENLVSENIDVISSSFKTTPLIDDYKYFLDLYIASKGDSEDSNIASTKKVRIL